MTTVQFENMMNELRRIRRAVESLAPEVDPDIVAREMRDGRTISYPRLPAAPDHGFVHLTVPQTDGGPDVTYQIARKRLVDPVPVPYPADPHRTGI